MVAVKQYLENSWYRGASQDRQTGYAAQYQYGHGVNTRDMKNGVCLAGGGEQVGSLNSGINVFTAFGNLYYIDGSGDIYDEDGTVKCHTLVTDIYAPICEEYGNVLFVIGDDKVVYVSRGWNTTTDLTPMFPTYHGYGYRGSGQCALNYANTFLLIGDLNVLWRFDLATQTVKGIRYFDSGYNIYGLSQEGNYLKIYTSNGLDTKIHYAKGTFDVEETGLVQTISYPGLAVNIGDVVSDQGNDYVIFRQDNNNDHSYKLSKVQGYNKIDIRWTETWQSQKIFSSTNPSVYASDGVVFAGMEDGIWTFTEYNGWLRGGCCEFPISGGVVSSMTKCGEYLYAVIKNGTKCTLMKYDMSFHPSTYQTNGYIIGRVFDGGCAGLFKKNVQTTITYNMPTGTSMELSYRYDRNSFNYNKSNFSSIKNLTDTNSCYDIVVPTTDSDFNKTWNLLEYRVDLRGNGTKTPILFEHNLLYNDSIRKYR